jgi:RsiW-degrading membrane proteinase PrsW (M82 family)
MVNTLIALVPVVMFLAALSLMDTFRLVRPTSIARALVYGAVAAGASLWLNEWLLHSAHVPAWIVGRLAAPAAEETAKAALIVVLIATARVGFLVDAAVQAFAIGTGFALVENVWYLRSIDDPSVALWVVRGCGTAVLHGATTTIFAIVSKSLADRRPHTLASVFLPGWAAAVVIHSAFNHRLLPPVAETLLLLIALPLLVVAVFERSERATREWIGAGLDLDIELIALMQSPDFAFTRFARYLQELRARLPGPVVADMFCLLRLELELSVQAKALLIAREAGLELPVNADLEAGLAERRYLQESIGKIGLLALKPLQVTSHRDTWHRHLLRRRRT